MSADVAPSRGTGCPPDGLPHYRLITGPDDSAFCVRVSDALTLGYQLHQGPTLTFDGETVIAGQALLWPSEERGG